MTEKISVIIPVYNVENQLQTCLDSVLGQTYQNLEIILINYGSTDNSDAICRSYADAPEIDGHVYVDNIDARVKVGEFLTVTIDEASEYDLFASFTG